MIENGEILKQKESLDTKEHLVNIVQENSRDKKSALQTQASTTPSLDDFLSSVAVFGAIMFFYFLCDDAHYFPASERTYSRDLFFFLTLLLFGVAAGFTKKETADKILNREQTEEWKGWMQVMFVWYHYFKAAETYNAIRVFIAAYVWMTGFGKYFCNGTNAQIWLNLDRHFEDDIFWTEYVTFVTHSIISNTISEPPPPPDPFSPLPTVEKINFVSQEVEPF